MSKVIYNPNKFNEGVNIFVSVNRSYNTKGEFTGRSLKGCIARAWYFYKEEEAALIEAFEKGLPVTVSGILHGEKVATYIAEAYEIIDIAEENPEVGHSRRFEFKLTSRVYEGAPIWKGSLGAHSVAVK
jgi:hypothetical protein